MESEMKTRRVIGVAKVTCPCNGLMYDKKILSELACAQEVELAVYVDSPPKRELVVPEGLKWIRSMVYPERERLIHNDTEIAMVQRDGGWCIVFDDIKHARSMDEGKQACYEAMATASINGFYWKTPEPDWSRYEVVTAWRRHISGECYSESRNLPDALDLVIVKAFFNNAKDILGCYVSVIEGRLPDGSVEIIDRWESEEKGK
jgi:hypothetical protein